MISKIILLRSKIIPSFIHQRFLFSYRLGSFYINIFFPYNCIIIYTFKIKREYRIIIGNKVQFIFEIFTLEDYHGKS